MAGTNFLVSFGKACSKGIDSVLCCWIGKIGTIDLLRVGEEGAEWGLGGGNGFKDALFNALREFLVGDVVGVTKGVLEVGGGCGRSKSSPL